MKTRCGWVGLIVLFLSGCGYFNAGSWEDDSQNWKRAFGSAQPQSIEVVHSRFMKTPHWSHEFEYFFQIKGTDEAHRLFLQSDNLKKFDSEKDRPFAITSFFQAKPSWFLPKPLDAYEVWIFKTEPRQNFRLFLDKESKEIFITDNQI